MTEADFNTDSNTNLAEEFLRQGYVIVPTENADGLQRIQGLVADLAAIHLAIERPNDATEFLNDIDQHVKVEGLNALRLAVISGIRNEAWFRPTYYQLAKNAIEQIVGNELAMQRGMGLSVQLPKDDSSLLPVHADVWDGDSPYEVVMWIPLVDCYKTKAMYLMPPDKDRDFQKEMANFKDASAEDIFNAIKEDVDYIEIPFGSILLFSQTLMHGNRLNVESETRWSMNCRFKSLLSPYADKKLGEFFEPLSIKPATRLGMAYDLPRGFDD